MDYNLSKEQLKGNEYVTIQAKIHSHHSITVTTIYCPPRIKPSANLYIAVSNPSYSLIMGDFNAKHVNFYCNKTNPSGTALQQILNNNSLSVIDTNEPTYISTTDILDLILCTPDLASKPHRFSTTNHLSSDHLPVLTTFSFHLQVTLSKRYKYSKADWETYKTYIESKLKDLPPPLLIIWTTKQPC